MLQKMSPRRAVKYASGVILVSLVALEKYSKRRALNIKEQEIVGSTMDTLRHNISLLEKEGVCVLHKAISSKGLEGCKQMESFSAAVEAKDKIVALKAAKFWQSTPGRFHLQSFSNEDSEFLTELEESWMPLVTSYLPTTEDTSSHRSDLQLLVSLPQSKDQFFHQDNRRQGLTVLIPLVNVTLENGPTQLLPRSHHLTAGAGEQVTSMDCSILSSMVEVEGSMRACIPAGSAVVYDSRTLHRGLANADPVESRPVLVFRYDYDDTPPPGHTVTSTILFRALGNILCGLGELKQGITNIF